MNDDEFHARLKELYRPPENQFTLVDVPDIRYMMVDGVGNPDNEDLAGIMKWLYSVVHVMKPYVTERMGKNFVYPPPEFLFWAKDEKDFIAGNKDKWNWRVMIVVAEFIPQTIFDDAVAEVEQKGSPAPKTLRLENLHEGKCVQTMHIGNYSEVSAVCKRLYNEYLPKNNLKPRGYYHEIYLNDPTRTAPAKRKTVIRQPVTDTPSMRPTH